MVMPVDFLHLIVKRAPHDMPHHHLDALGACFAHVFGVSNPGERQRILGQAVEKCCVKFPIDEAGAFPCNWCDMPPVP